MVGVILHTMPAFHFSITRHSSSHPPSPLLIPLQPSSFISLTSKSLPLSQISISQTKTHLLITQNCSTPDSNFDTTLLKQQDDPNDADDAEEGMEDCNSFSGVGFCIEIEKLGKNSRRIRSKIEIDASLDDVWRLLTSYDNLADFIPGLAVSQLIEKKGNTARLYQIGQQNLPLGFKFNAKAILDCYEKDLEASAYQEQRDIEFKMIEGDFQLFEGKWSIEQFKKPIYEGSSISDGRVFDTVLSYFVDVKPKLWLPVYLVEDILCKEIMANLLSIREEAEKASKITSE